jgi:predicted DNA-binding WGR domain protein
MATRFVDFETKICADWLNTVDDAVVDALGTPQTPEQARVNIGAVEEAPQDSSPYVRVNASWQSASASIAHNDLAGRGAADAHPQGSITGLDARLTSIEAVNSVQDANIAGKASQASLDAFIAQQDVRDDGQDTLIAGKASQASLDAFISQQDARDDAQDALIALKADKTYVDNANAAQDAVIATKASITYVDQQNAIQDANTLALIVALG